ncbi:cell wall surface anchor family protein [Streptococcus pneumoniae]|nr:cell wall surface anchor family protein [Streptococcus pneumoniae]
MKFNPNQRYTRWSIRRLSVGVASVVVASGFFVLVGQPSSVRADVVNPTPGQVLPEETSGTKEGDLSEKPGDTVLTQAKPEGVTGNTNSLPTPTERTEVSEETNSSSLDTLFEKDEEAQENPELTDALKETVDTADVDGTQASPAETTPEQVKGGVKENTKDSIDVPAAYLEKAEGKGPFTAGVNQVIPYELFAGDGMLTRLLLKASDNAPWSDNGTAKNPALPPLEGLTKGKYFYEVDLNGNTVGKQGQALIDQLRANGTQTYKATVKVYGNKDGKADLTNLVATKNVDININGLVAKETVEKAVKDNVKDSIDVPAAYLEKAKGEGPFTAGVNQVIPYELFAGDGMLTRLLLKASDNAPWSDNGTAKNPALPPLEGLTKGKYFYEVDLNGNTVGKQGQALIDQLRANGTQTYKATVKVYGNKDGKADLTNLVATKNVDININGLVAKETVQKAVADNVKDSIDVPAAYLEKAKGEGPFTAGVNHVIPYELFAGDGMLTRLLLKASDKAPWSDNGDAKNPALSPLGENVKTKGQYFYQVALDGNVAGKEKQALIDQFRANGTQTYSATVNVYGNKDGKPDLDNIVATKKVTININGLISKETVQKAVADNVKDSIDVPAAYLEKAKGEGPFTAGVNHVIPYELFAGDGMLTRLLLKASDKAPWSDNGDAKNPALSPLGENVKTKGQYFYQVALDGNVAGKEKQALIDQFRANGTQTYSATVNVYGNKDGKPDLDNIVATKKVTININGLISKETVQKAVADNVKDSIDVPAAYLEKAKGEGPFTAGVNHVIPYELFAGDGMLTRLLLKASDKAPWSDNGDAKNPALSPLGENVKTKGQYFYQVALDGNVAGKEKQALIDQFRANGTQTYSATVNVYGNKDGKPDLDNIVATKKVTIKINVKETSDTANGSLSPSNSGSGVTPMNHNHATGTTDSMPADTMTSSTNTMAGENMAASANKMSDTMMSEDKAMLPNTGETQTSMASIGFLGLALAGLLGGLGLKNKKEEN